LPTIFTHSFTGIASGIAVYDKSVPKRFWTLSVICSLIPDADVIGFKLGIPYSHFFGHRGFFHSLSFACILGSLIGLLFMKTGKRGWKDRLFFAGYFSFLICIHDILDAFTNGGLGIALLSPFTSKRYFFWITPIEVSPISPQAFFSGRAFGILRNEFFSVWIPYIAIVLVCRFLFKRRVLKLGRTKLSVQ
jgi:inner membrane protein